MEVQVWVVRVCLDIGYRTWASSGGLRGGAEMGSVRETHLEKVVGDLAG